MSNSLDAHAIRAASSAFPPVRRVPVSLRWVFVGATFGAGTTVLCAAIASLTTQSVGWYWLLLAVLTWLSAPLALKVPGAHLTLTISESLSFMIAIGVGWEAAVLTVAVDGLLTSLRQRSPRLDRTLFNVAEPALSMAACALVLDWLTGMPGAERLGAPLVSLIVPAFAATSTYLLLNSVLTATAVAIETGANLQTTWRRHVTWLALDHMGGTSMALLVISGARGSGVVGILAALPLLGGLYLTYRTSIRRAEDALQYAERLNGLYLGTVESLAMAIDAKDHVTHGHIMRVRVLAGRVADAMGLRAEPMTQALEAGALLHDVGKLGVPDHILNKPGPLTPAEYEQVKLHTVIGAEIVSRVDYPYPVAPIVRHHHENWDGTGYPDGLRGETIPIGARILSVIDCYDALTSDRPYRLAMSHEEATAIVTARRGTMYDPAVVDAFLGLPIDEHHVATAAAPRPSTLRITGELRSAAATHVDGVSAGAPAAACLVRTVATLAVHHDYHDVMELIGSQLARLTPASTVALFVANASGTGLRLGWASGPAAADLAAVRLVMGQGVSGWVAAHRWPLLNAAAVLEFHGTAATTALPAAALSTAVETEPGQVGGVITLYSQHQEFTPADQDLLQAVARAMAPCLCRESTGECRPTSPGDAARTRPDREDLDVSRAASARLVS